MVHCCTTFLPAKAVPDTENMSLRDRDRYNVVYLRDMLKSRLYNCVFETFDRADTYTWKMHIKLA